jgi:hypothetical protein
MRLPLRFVWVGAWGFIAGCGSTEGPTTQAAQGTDASGVGRTFDADASPPPGNGSSGGIGSSGGSSSSGGSQSPGDDGSAFAPSDASGPGRPDASGLTDGPAGAPDAGAATGNGDAGARQCKRGVAANAAPGSAFSPSPSQPGVSWWYNWATQGSGQGAGIEFVPMIWGSGSLHSALPAGSKYVLGFNEPNFKSQSNLTAAQAAADWPSVETAAKATGAFIVSPAVNFCGSSSNASQCSDPTVTDPYTYLKDFFADCSGCKVDYIAVHWYNCDLPSLRAYIEGNVDAGGGLQGFLQFGKPIWLTEFSCDSSHSVASQKAYMQSAVPYLENNPHVFRYSWFSASNIPTAQLANADGSLTDLGKTYVGLPQSCR